MDFPVNPRRLRACKRRVGRVPRAPAPCSESWPAHSPLHDRAALLFYFLIRPSPLRFNLHRFLHCLRPFRRHPTSLPPTFLNRSSTPSQRRCAVTVTSSALASSSRRSIRPSRHKSPAYPSPESAPLKPHY
ncbi:hypothetical protein KSP39_PZI009343 [Platanthera zijinensis]|uniref:Uncharacterized protein n=1 Tax=Platanthera zijinensis TaxID=2320716 RepID=A0AAP0G829_9ASPA